MTNRGSPCLTSWPSLKLTLSMNPETRARTSTCSTATKRPVYSSHSVIVFFSGCATVTGGGGGAEAATGLPSQLASACAMSTRALRGNTRVIGIGLQHIADHLSVRIVAPFDAEHGVDKDGIHSPLYMHEPFHKSAEVEMPRAAG